MPDVERFHGQRTSCGIQGVGGESKRAPILDALENSGLDILMKVVKERKPRDGEIYKSDKALSGRRGK